MSFSTFSFFFLMYHFRVNSSPLLSHILPSWSLILSLHSNTQTRSQTLIWIHTNTITNAYWHGTKWVNANPCQPCQAVIGSYDLTSWPGLASVCPHPCGHPATQRSTHKFPILPVWLASSTTPVPKGQRWPLPGSSCSMSLLCSVACLYVCVCVCVVNATAWPHWSRLLSWSFSSVYHEALISRTLLLYLPKPPFLLASLLFLFFWFNPTALLLSISHPPSVLLAQIDRIESLGLSIVPKETHIVSVQAQWVLRCICTTQQRATMFISYCI